MTLFKGTAFSESITSVVSTEPLSTAKVELLTKENIEHNTKKIAI